MQYFFWIFAHVWVGILWHQGIGHMFWTEVRWDHEGHNHLTDYQRLFCEILNTTLTFWANGTQLLIGSQHCWHQICLWHLSGVLWSGQCCLQFPWRRLGADMLTWSTKIQFQRQVKNSFMGCANIVKILWQFCTTPFCAFIYAHQWHSIYSEPWSGINF